MTEPWSVQKLLRDMAARGDLPALMLVRGDRFESWSYGRLADLAQRLACGLVAEGLEPGQPVALLSPNRPEWVVARLALALAGALAVPIDDLSTDGEIAAILADSGCRLAFTASAHLPALQALEADLEVVLLDGKAGEGRSWRELLADSPQALPARDPSAPAVMIYTSGTTGRPKAFALSEANMAANVESLTAEGVVGAGDHVLLPLPLHHVYPYVVGTLTPLTNGATVVFPEAVSGPKLAEALRVGHVGVVVGVPRLYAAILAAIEARAAARGRMAAWGFQALLASLVWLRRRLGWTIGAILFRPLRQRIAPKLWLMVSGGAPFEAALIWKLEALGWRVLSGYGLAETASIFTANFPGHRQRIGSEGRPLGDGELRIAEPDDAGVGEIQLRGISVFSGYHNDPQETEAAFTAGGWFRTGDLGRLDEDGFLYVTGRAKELIVLGGGKNVFPEALEKFYGVNPCIAEIAVLERTGKLVALVRPQLEAVRASGSARIEQVLRVAIAEISQGLPTFQRIAGFAIVREPLPRTRLGKIRRFLLPELYAQAVAGVVPAPVRPPSAEDKAWLAEPDRRAIWDWLAARYPEKKLTLDTSPQLDLGIDSLEWIGITLELQQRFGARLREQDAADALTIRDLIRAIEAAGPGVAEAAAAAPEHDPQRWLRPAGPGLAALSTVLWALNRLTVRLLLRLRVEGVELLPKEAPFVLAANHVSDLDGFVLAAALPHGRFQATYWSGEVTRLFANPPARLFSRAAHIFPVDERRPGATLDMARAVLSRDKALAWFPEAWRSPDGTLQPFLPGVGQVLEQTGVPVVPVFISGTFAAMPRGRRLPRPSRVVVRFGPVLDPAELVAAGAGKSPAHRIADALKARVAALAPAMDERN